MLVASCTLILIASVIGIVVGTQRAGTSPTSTAAQTTSPAAPPTAPPSAAQTAAADATPDTASPAPPGDSPVTGVSVDEPLDSVEPSEEMSKPSEPRRRAKADARARRAQVRARAVRREKLERQSNTKRLLSMTCADIGETDIKVIPGAEIDADGDGVGCES